MDKIGAVATVKVFHRGHFYHRLPYSKQIREFAAGDVEVDNCE